MKPIRQPQSLPVFIEEMKPLEKGLALFDADGTLWHDDASDDFTTWCLQTNKIDKSDLWEKYLELFLVNPPNACEFALKLFAGLTRSQLKEYVYEWWTQHSNRKWIHQTIETIYHLKNQGHQIWIVTASATEVMGPLFDFLPIDKIIGMDIEFIDDVATGSHSGISCADHGKALKVKQFNLENLPIHLSVGNSMMDIPLIELSQNIKWSIFPNDDLLDYSNKFHWKTLK